MPESTSGRPHSFFATAFVENLPLKELSAAFPEAKRSPRELWFQIAAGGTVFIYPFGAVVFFDVAPETRAAQLERLNQARTGLTKAQVLNEELTVREAPEARPDIENGVLVVDTLGHGRASVVALTVAQSAAMDYYERIVDQMFVETDKLGNELEKAGTMPMRTRHLLKFIGATISTRSEVLSILHLLDMPDAAWDDPGAERIYHRHPGGHHRCRARPPPFALGSNGGAAHRPRNRAQLGEALREERSQQSRGKRKRLATHGFVTARQIRRERRSISL
jgi:hypothetical protein